MDETIRERLLKILELVDRGGTQGERDSAKHHLDVLLEKYGLTLDDVMRANAPKHQVRYTWSSEFEKRLIVQVAYMIAGEERGVFVAKDGRKSEKRKRIYGSN